MALHRPQQDPMTVQQKVNDVSSGPNRLKRKASGEIDGQSQAQRYSPPSGLDNAFLTAASNSDGATSGCLTADQVFSVQVGRKLFRLTGASLSSDAVRGPSRLTQSVQGQLCQSNAGYALHFDRNPVTFPKIVLHLKGYHVEPENGDEFAGLIADAHFYRPSTVPRLSKRLLSAEIIYVRVGDESVKVHRDLFFKPGDSPNRLIFIWSTKYHAEDGAFASISPVGPDCLEPLHFCNRSGAIFADLLRLLEGEEGKAVPGIFLRVKDVQMAGLVGNANDFSKCQRPFVDNVANLLITETGEQILDLDWLNPGRPPLTGTAKFSGQDRKHLQHILNRIVTVNHTPPPEARGGVTTDLFKACV
ncbi:unnamed protein product [Zymoseptoria tritici ST99CH_3D7]|uniref:Potassium channel tetramerisation-type BTB domain-containing protein n=1 Tax=Zymoseptoria tritici (strain ST99CH_3D7) TaxID=1276538 RepID=A0A1X7RJC9_ZYMT9|nr:unnamed protein product [Zymoseptoria tritici ST99CH_3D7]